MENKKIFNFALIGVGGYIAPRHMEAIKKTGNVLSATLDPNDSVGIIDRYFPEAAFFLEPERFDRHLDKLRRKGDHRIDYVSICSPNYLHDAHIRLALRNDAHAICEKPLVLNPWNIDALSEIEHESGKSIHVILQLRLHPHIISLREKIKNSPPGKIFDIDLTYITGRGQWYYRSWKGNVEKSGGIATNIGIHFFDMLIWIFGDVKQNMVHYSDKSTASGYLILEKARVKWFLSLDTGFIPEQDRLTGKRTYRSITVDKEEIEFSEGFTDLHIKSYEEILAGNGFNIGETRASIETVFEIRNAVPVGKSGEYHPILDQII